MPDISTFPTAPGKPIQVNVSDDNVYLEWTPPEKSGATIITGYILQYFSQEMGKVSFLYFFCDRTICNIICVMCASSVFFLKLLYSSA